MNKELSIKNYYLEKNLEDVEEMIDSLVEDYYKDVYLSTIHIRIILDLKGKLEFIGVGISDNEIETTNELKEVLIGLGYKEKELKPVLAKVNTSLSIEEQVKDALKLLLK